MSKRQKLLARQRAALDRADREAAEAIAECEDEVARVEDREARRFAARTGGVR